MMYIIPRDNTFVYMILYMGKFYVLFINRVSLLNEKYRNHSPVDNAYTINFH